jgi:MurNAc alpha-1-phosphate uridylyltransferase
MVLAAGLGTRMRPLTDTIPKPMVRVAARPLIDHVLDRLVEAGITTAVVNVHYRPEPLLAHLEKRQRPHIRISDERDRVLDTGGGVKKALPLLGEGPFLVHNSDSIWLDGAGSNLDRLTARWDDATMDGLLLLALGATSIGYDGFGDFLMAPDGLLARRPDRDLAPFVFTGVSIVHPRLLIGTPDGKFSLNDPFDRAIARGRLYGLRLDGIWMHVGDPLAIAPAERALRGELDD